MNLSKQLTRYSSLPSISLFACVVGILSLDVNASAQNETQQQSIISEQLFSSPDEAVKALNVAVKADDQVALRRIFGPEFDEILTGDAVQDANNVKRFATIMEQRCQRVYDGENQITLVVGDESWPFPIPLVNLNGQWHFDTAAGKEEIVNRHIGKDELNAIGVCRAYVIAQKRYASMNPEGRAGTTYARHLKSLPGKKDGLYWPAVNNQPSSPFGPLVAEAQAEGYVVHPRGTGPHPFNGYYFRILTRQGDVVPRGKLDYLTDGNLTKGFALVAYPVAWGQSGIMTFIVNQDGRVYQQDLGENTSYLAQEMKEYNPNSGWTLVQDKGIDGVLLAPSQR